MVRKEGMIGAMSVRSDGVGVKGGMIMFFV